MPALPASSDLPPLPTPMTAEWLTLALRAAGALPRGAVSMVAEETTGAFNSATSRLALTYGAGAGPDAPARLILKRNIATDWGVAAGADEARFYALVASLPDHPPIIPPCYAVAHDPASGRSYVLLRDLSATHRPPITRDQQIGLVEGVPAAADLTAVVETLARLHAYWWEHPLLAAGQFEVGYWSRDAERLAAYCQRRTAAWERLLAGDGAWLPVNVRARYASVLAALPAFWERRLAPRFRERRALTLIHGDAYFANFLCPIPPATGPTYLLDWQTPGADLGGYDLANLLATFWTPEQRHAGQRELALLRHYHATLQAHGVTRYTWDDLTLDYRLGLIFWLLMPVQDAAGGAARSYWWPKMRCLLAAFHDWQCAELLGSGAA